MCQIDIYRRKTISNIETISNLARGFSRLVEQLQTPINWKSRIFPDSCILPPWNPSISLENCSELFGTQYKRRWSSVSNLCFFFIFWLVLIDQLRMIFSLTHFKMFTVSRIGLLFRRESECGISNGSPRLSQDDSWGFFWSCSAFLLKL